MASADTTVVTKRAKPVGPAWTAYVAYRRNWLTGMMMWAGWSAVGSVVTLGLFLGSWLPGWDGPILEFRRLLAAFFLLGLPGCLLSILANQTARRAAAVGDERLVARARSRQLTIQSLIFFGVALVSVSFLVPKGMTMPGLPGWMQGLVATNLLGLAALGVVKDQYEDSVAVAARWFALPAAVRAASKKTAEKLVGFLGA